MPFIRVRLKGIRDARAAARRDTSCYSRLLKIQSSDSKAVWENTVIRSSESMIFILLL